MCDKESPLPLNGFLINEFISKLASERPKEVYRGKEIEQLKMDIEILEDLNKDLLQKKNMSLIIDLHCDEQIKLIELAIEKLLDEIKKYKEILIQKVKDYKLECKRDFLEKNALHGKSNEIINRVNLFLDGNYEIFK